VNVRILSATNRDLSQAIVDGSFRQDLYHRLRVVTIDLPALAERREDIVPLADHFRKQFARKHRKTVHGISGPVSRKLFGYDWPGNVRQLRNCVESMVVIDSDATLDVDDLPPELADLPQADMDEGPVAGPAELIGRPLNEIERWAIEQTLLLAHNNREETARILGIGARTLYRKLKEYGI
jgi:two-component system response regulator HydG